MQKTRKNELSLKEREKMKLAKVIITAAGIGVFIGLLDRIEDTPLRAGIGLTVAGIVAATHLKTAK